MESERGRFGGKSENCRFGDLVIDRRTSPVDKTLPSTKSDVVQPKPPDLLQECDSTSEFQEDRKCGESSTKLVKKEKEKEKEKDNHLESDRITRKLSFAAVLNKPKMIPRFKPFQLAARQYSKIEGKLALSFSSEEIEIGAQHYRFSLIAKFTFGRPPIETIRRTLQAAWDIKVYIE